MSKIRKTLAARLRKIAARLDPPPPWPLYYIVDPANYGTTGTNTAKITLGGA